MEFVSELELPAILEKVQEVVASCTSEEDLRIALEAVFRECLPELERAKYERVVKGPAFFGRVDALHKGVVIEYERPASMRNSAHRRHAIRQVEQYMEAIALGFALQEVEPTLFAEERPALTDAQEDRLSASVGIATDGETWVFVQRYSGEWDHKILGLSTDSLEKAFLWLRSLQRKRLVRISLSKISVRSLNAHEVWFRHSPLPSRRRRLPNHA